MTKLNIMRPSSIYKIHYLMDNYDKLKEFFNTLTQANIDYLISKLSPLRKVVKYGNATKTLRHQDSQRIYFQCFILREILCFCAFVAK